MFRFACILIFFAVAGINAETAQGNGEVDITKHPYVVSIRKDGHHVCTGVIINRFHIVTSDRCVPPFEHSWNVMNGITIVTGTNSLNVINHHFISKEMFSQNHYINPTKNPVTSGLGVIKLLDPIKFGDGMQPVSLAKTEIPVGAKLQMIGWNIADTKGNKSPILKEITVETVHHQECQPFHSKTLQDFEFCTLSRSEGFCKGDSGSALIYEGKLVGLATYGISCEDKPTPDVHTSINKMHDYLHQFMKAVIL